MYFFTVTPDQGEPYEVETRARDVRLWERTGHHNTIRRIAENPSFDDYYALVHIAIKRQRIREVPSLAEFMETHDVLPKAPDVSGALSYDELLIVVEREMTNPDVTSSSIAGVIMGLLEVVRERAMDPTQPGR